MNLRIALLLFVVAPLFAAEDSTPPGKAYVYKHSAGKPRQMEIYFPEDHDPAGKKVPGVILFHGGGWGSGSLLQFRAACQYFASRGLVCATAEYRKNTPTNSGSIRHVSLRAAGRPGGIFRPSRL